MSAEMEVALSQARERQAGTGEESGLGQKGRALHAPRALSRAKAVVPNFVLSPQSWSLAIPLSSLQLPCSLELLLSSLHSKRGLFFSSLSLIRSSYPEYDSDFRSKRKTTYICTNETRARGLTSVGREQG